MLKAEISVQHAIDEAPRSARQLEHLSALHRAAHSQLDTHQTIRHWVPQAGTYCYQTHIAISAQNVERFNWLTGVLYNAASLPHQPWYPQFQGGHSQPCDHPAAADIEHHQLTWGCFDLGLGKPRYYRQLVSLARLTPTTSIIVARSVDADVSLPPGATVAFTPQPNGEVLHWQDGCLHWHHICCTPGAALLPGRLDRWFINGLRSLGLDGAERKTYASEALQMRDWLQQGEPDKDVPSSAATITG